MDLRDVKKIVNDEGYVGEICPVNRHVSVRYDDFDEECITFLDVTAEGFVKEDDAILDTDGSVVARTPDELRAWLEKKTS